MCTHVELGLLPKQTPELIAKKLKRGTYAIEPYGLLKRCSRCKEYWPADLEFFFSAPSKTDGIFDWCKACYLEWRWPFGRTQAGIEKAKQHGCN